MSDLDAERDLQIALLLDEAMAEWRAHGRLDESVWRARYPDLADEIPGLLDTLRALDTAASDWKLTPPPAPPGTVAAPPTTAGAPSDRPPDHVGRYRILESIGVGGMGAVYRAEDPQQLSRVVAVKFPRLDTPTPERARAVQRFLREARAAARVRHPHICPIYDVGEEGGWPYVVMALVEGPSLAERLTHGRYDDLQAAAALAGQVAEALAAVHSHGIVHRDLKPANILLDADGRAVLTDFGLAYPSDDAERLTAAGAVVGTPAYMAPEQASGESSRVGPPADLYSLGVVLYQMVTGRLPYEGQVLGVLGRILSTPPPPPSQFRPGLDPALEGVILKAMARRPKDRFPNARAFADALRRWAAGQPGPHDQPTRDAADKPGPAVVRVDMPDGNPITVSVDHGTAAPGKVAVSVREGRAVKGKRRRLAVTVTITFALLIGVGLAASGSLVIWWLRPPGDAQGLPGQLAQVPPWGGDPVKDKGIESFPPSPGNPLTRVRTARVQITCDVEVNGAMEKKELPFVVGVLADLSGSPAAPTRALKDRKFVQIDRDNLDAVLKKCALRLALTVPNRIGGDAPLKMDIAFESMDDFEPAAVVRKIPLLQALLDSRKTAKPDEVATIDAKLSAQLSEVLHQPDYQRLESAWRGLYYLVVSTETSESLKIRVMDVSKTELARDAARAADFDQTVLYKKVYEEEFGQLGGEPYGLLIGDYAFGRDPQDVELLQSIADVAAYAHAPFVAAMSPEPFGVTHFSDLPSVRDLAARFAGPGYEAWRAFRASDSSRYVGLTMPRVLARLPYGVATKAIDDFDFEESVDGEGRSSFLWMSAAWPFAVRVTDAWAKYSWPARIQGWEGGGKVEGIPLYDFPAGNDESPLRSFTEVSVYGRREKELSDLGLLPLLHVSGQEAPAFTATPSCHQPHPGPQASDEESQLNVLLCASRFVQYTQILARDRLGAFEKREDVAAWMNKWLGKYVLSEPEKADAADEAKRPLTVGRVDLRELRGKPGFYEAVIQIRPNYQLDEPSPPLRLTAEIPMPSR